MLWKILTKVATTLLKEADNAKWWIRHRTYDRYDRIYITSLKPGYYDKDEQMLHGMFGLLIDYVDKEEPFRYFSWGKDHKNDPPEMKEFNEERRAVKKEIISLYNWWKVERPRRAKSYSVIEPVVVDGETISGFELMGIDQNHPAVRKHSKQVKQSGKIDDDYDKEDTLNLIRLVKIRGHLWTLMKYLTVDLTHRLPDINRYENLPANYSDYGRVAITKNGMTVSGIMSSHPSNTIAGFYWATSGDVLYISPRGCMEDMNRIDDDIIKTLVKRVGLKSQYKYFKIKK